MGVKVLQPGHELLKGDFAVVVLVNNALELYAVFLERRSESIHGRHQLGISLRLLLSRVFPRLISAHKRAKRARKHQNSTYGGERHRSTHGSGAFASGNFRTSEQR